MVPWHHLFIIVAAAILVYAPVTHSRGIPNVFRKESYVNKGLYQTAPHVQSMNFESLPSSIYGKPFATYLEFYNSYCGFCRRFAPHWKDLSEDVQSWRDVVQIGALDCSLDENGDVCRQFSVTSYPSIRYIPPMYATPKEGAPQIGQFVGSADHTLIKQLLVQYLANETNPQPQWPNFKPLVEPQASAVLDTAAPETVVGFVFVQDDLDNGNSTTSVPAEIMLDFHATKKAVFRRTNESLPWMPSNSEHSPRPWLFVVTADWTSGNVLEAATLPITKQVIVDKVKENLRRLNLLEAAPGEKPADKEQQIPANVDQLSGGEGSPVKDEPSITDVMEEEQQKSIIQKVKTMKDTVFRADLDMALQYALFHEVSTYSVISGDRLIALKQFIAVVGRYFPFSGNGQLLIKDLQDFVMAREESLSGKEFEAEAKRLEVLHRPVFSSTRWVGCASYSGTKRRFPCSLWTMFHHLTVAADEQEKSTDPLEVLDAMHGYVKHFFGCTDCSRHFQEMAAKNKMSSITSKDMAILWLWSAHNEVNERLQGDETEDVDFPKVQFPTREICPKCYKAVSNASGGEVWDKTEVIFFLKRMHSVQALSIFGVNNEMALPGVAERLMAQRTGRTDGGGLFDDHDFRLGLILYVCSLALIIVAVKMFVKRRGCFYRKKLYVHDMLGKV